MKKRLIFVFVLALAITVSSLFVEIVPCTSWYGSNTGVADSSPHEEFCKVSYSELGPHNEYFGSTISPSAVLVLIFIFSLLIILAIVFVVGFFGKRRDVSEAKK